MTVPAPVRGCQCEIGAEIGHGLAALAPRERRVLSFGEFEPAIGRAIEDVNVAFVTLREGEPPEAIVGRFRAAVTRNGILKEHKDRRFFRSKGEKARLAARRSARRRRRSGG